MGQAEVLKFLERYRHSKKFSKKKWLTAREIYDRLKNTKKGSQINSITSSLRKLREIEMVKYKKLSVKNPARMILHYQAK